MSTAINDTPTPYEVTSAAATVVFPTKRGSGDNIYNQICSKDCLSDKIVANLESEIKMEPPEDINDDVDCAPSFTDKSPGDNLDGPKIRLKPTIKLMPVSNPVDHKRRFTCPYDNCTKSYGKSSHLRSHLTWHTGIKPFVCTEANCGKGFTRSDELNRHVRTHTGEKPFECIQCTKKFSRSDHLTKHLATHVKQMQNIYDGTKKPRKESYATNASKELYVNLCDLSDTKACLEDTKCPEDYTKQEKQKDFLQLQHDLSEDQQDMLQQRDLEEYDAGNGMHFMASLAKIYDEKDTVKKYEPLLDHRPIKIKLERPENSGEYHVVKPDTPAKTDSSAVMSQLGIPIPIIKQEDTTLDASVHVLPADRTLLDWPGIEQQGDVYDRPWRCNLCAKKFKRQDDLNRHLRTHTGEKPYLCVACNRGFKRSDHLKKHLKTHTNLR